MRRLGKPVACALFLIGRCLAQDSGHSKLVVAVDTESFGPFGGAQAVTCMRVLSDGTVFVAGHSISGVKIVDKKTGKEAIPESRYSKKLKFKELDFYVDGFQEFVTSARVRDLASVFDSPHPAIDFFETTKVTIPLPDTSLKTISVNEYDVASLSEKALYPAPLIVMMGEFKRLESEVSHRGEDSPAPAECKLEFEKH